MRKQALTIVEAGIESVLPSAIMAQAVKFNPAEKFLTINGTPYHIGQGRIFVIGGGKASGAMAETLEKIIAPDHIVSGVVNCPGSAFLTKKIKLIKASHPTPNRSGVNGVKKMLALKTRFSPNKNDLVICLISGGGSALMPCPAEGINLKDKKKITKLLIARGPTIHEINAVRKHLSRIKGGRLGSFFSPARLVALILSDVIGNDLDVIGSGPTAPDTSTFADALQVLEKYHILQEAPASIVALLKKGRAGEIPETPKTTGELANCFNHIIGDNKKALAAMAEKAEEMGFKPIIVSAEQKGDPVEMAQLRAHEILNGKYSGYNVILAGGETTPKLPKKHGKGGRNQHYAAASMMELENYPGEYVLAGVGTDGSDYLKKVAGAVVDKISFEKARTKKINIQAYLDRFDAYRLFKKIGNSLVKTGATGANVGDLAVYILGK